MLTATLFVAGWLFLGWVGWRLIIWWWTSDMDMTRANRNKLMVMAFAFGPAAVVSAAILCATAMPQRLNRKDPNEIIYPRRDKT